jgi:hypothetical protein
MVRSQRNAFRFAPSLRLVLGLTLLTLVGSLALRGIL